MKPLWVLLVALLLPALAAAQTATPCPKELGAGIECWKGQDAEGAYYWAAKPKAWNGVLLVHSHGGPRLPPPKPDDPEKDLARFAPLVEGGFAWIGSSYRRGGYGVGMAVEDTESVRKIFLARIGKPRLTIAHGQSWGGNVAAKLAETVASAPGGKGKYDGVFLTSGVLGGGTHGYDFRLDLRVVYEYVCGNHPLPTEPQYPLWMGLPADSELTRKDLAKRVDACTGVGSPAEKRTPAQQRNLADILTVVKIPERTLVAHLAWATFLFRDVVQKRLGGKNPFGNMGVQYVGSHDDAALNQGVLRYAPDPAAVAQLAADSDLTGAISLPVVTVHAIDDPTAFVEHESRYRDAVVAAGRAQWLEQNFVDEHEHSFLTAPDYLAALHALVEWIDTGHKPTPASIAAACPQYAAGSGRCSFVPDYQPKPFNSRSYPRG